MFSTRVLTFLAICLCTLQLSTCNVIKLSAKNGNKNINKIKVGWITLLPFFVLSFRDLFAIVLFFYLLADSCCSKGRNNYKYSTSPNPNHSSFHVEIQLLPGICKSTLLFNDVDFHCPITQGEFWEISDCNSPSPDCVSIVLPSAAANSAVNEKICCASPQPVYRMPGWAFCTFNIFNYPTFWIFSSFFYAKTFSINVLANNLHSSAIIVNSLLDGTSAGTFSPSYVGSEAVPGLEGACFDYDPEQMAPVGDPIIHITLAVLE